MHYGRIKFFKKLAIMLLLLTIIITYIIYRVSKNSEISESKIWVSKMKNMESEVLADEAGNTYYISSKGGATEGTDINNPMSLTEANKRTFYGNDKILFKCGEEFFGTIKFKIDAEDGEMVYIGSYGEGDKPIISGANTILSANAWQKEDNGLYRMDMLDSSIVSGFGTLGIEPYNVGFIRTEEGKIFGNRKATKEELINEMDFACDERYLYVKCTDNPSVKYGQLKTVARNDLVVVYSNTIVTNLDIKDTGAHGIVKKDSEVKNVYIHDCIIQNIGGSVLSGDLVRYGNGIEFYNGNIENIVVQNNIFRNIYDVSFTCQGNTGYWKNIEISNNIFILTTQNCEFWTSAQTGGIENLSYHDNISINTGNGWGYEVRPNKLVAADFLMYDYNAQELGISLENNKIFNSRRLNCISNVQRFTDEVKSDYNCIYGDEDMFLFGSELTIQQKDEFISKYNKEKNSQFIVLDEEEIEKISNNQIMYSDEYNEIKKYYNNLEEEFKYNELVKNIVAKYSDFQQKFQTEISVMSDISTTITTLKNNVKTLTSENIWDNIESLYKTGETIIDKYKNKTSNISKQKIEEILTEINKIGESYLSLIDNMQITQNPQITDLQTLLQKADKLNLSLAENSDLDIADEKTWRDLIKDSLETLQDTETSTEHKSYNYIKAKNLLTWTSNMLEIYIDEYIQANPINITYSTTALTNKDVTATLNIGSDCHITNNNNLNSYVFKDNAEFTFEYERRGRSFQAKATVNNIDKTAPVITGVTDGQVYNTAVKLQITDQNLEKIDLYLNGNFKESYKQLQSISEEGLYQVKATDKAGNVTTISFDIIYREEDQYDVTTDKICNITVNTSVEKIADKLPIQQKYTILRNNNELQNGEKVATGDILKLTSGREYTLIVKGDVNSDGTVNIVDLVRTQNAILKRRDLTNIEELAADANYDKEQITIKDLVRIQMTILNPPKM